MVKITCDLERKIKKLSEMKEIRNVYEEAKEYEYDEKHLIEEIVGVLCDTDLENIIEDDNGNKLKLKEDIISIQVLLKRLEDHVYSYNKYFNEIDKDYEKKYLNKLDSLKTVISMIFEEIEVLIKEALYFVEVK